MVINIRILVSHGQCLLYSLPLSKIEHTHIHTHTHTHRKRLDIYFKTIKILRKCEPTIPPKET